MQWCKCGGAACKSAKVAYKSIEYGVLSIGRYNVSGGGWRLQVAGGGKRDKDTGETGDRVIGRGATASRPWGSAQMGSDTFSIPNEVRPHCTPTPICHIGNRIGIETIGLK